MTAALLLFVVMALVLLTNFGERNNADKISKAVASLYEDRLVVGSYIFDNALHLQKISETSGKNDVSDLQKKRIISTELAQIKTLNGLYLKTVLTKEEKKQFDTFSALCKSIEKQNDNLLYEQLQKSTAESIEILKSLSKLQVAEGKMQMANVTSLYTFSNFYSHFELGILIVIALIIQALVIASKNLRQSSSIPEQINLN